MYHGQKQDRIDFEALTWITFNFKYVKYSYKNRVYPSRSYLLGYTAMCIILIYIGSI